MSSSSRYLPKRAAKSIHVYYGHILPMAVFSFALYHILLKRNCVSTVTPVINVEHTKETNVENYFHPLLHNGLYIERMRHQCSANLPSPEEVDQYPYKAWPVDRFVAYYNIHQYLKKLWTDRHTNIGRNGRFKVLDFGGSMFLKPFNRSITVEFTKYPKVDVHRTSYDDDTFDAVAADQVLEHVINPFVAMLEMKRILRPGGIALLTTVMYNPIHESRNFHDFWRFTPDGLRVLSMPFKQGIKLCGSWGTKEVISSRNTYGLGEPMERKIFTDNRTDILTKNDDKNILLVWLVVQK